MSCYEIINVIGLCINLIGTIILTFSLSKYLTSLHGSIVIHDMTINGIVNQDNRVLTGNIGGLLKKGVKLTVCKVRIGLLFLVVGFFLQLLPYIMRFLYCGR